MASKPALRNGVPLITSGFPQFFDDSGSPCDCCCLTCGEFWARFAGVDLTYSGGRELVQSTCDDVPGIFLNGYTQSCLGTGLNTSLTLGPGDVEGEIELVIPDCGGPPLYRSVPCDANETDDCLVEEYLARLSGGISCLEDGSVSVSLGTYTISGIISGTPCTEDGLTVPCCSEDGFVLGECSGESVSTYTIVAVGSVSCIRDSAEGDLVGCCAYGPECSSVGGATVEDCDTYGDPCDGTFDVGNFSILLSD